MHAMSDLSQKSWSPTRVRCLSGYRADERPISFLLDGVDTEIRSILASWREPGYQYFKIKTKDGRVYEIRHHEYEDFWQMMAFG